MDLFTIFLRNTLVAIDFAGHPLKAMQEIGDYACFFVSNEKIK